MTHSAQLMALAQGFTTWVLYFFAYGFVGWLWESGYVSVRKHRWVNSGFLTGPVIPVYGFSMTAVLAVIHPFQHNLLMLYLLSVLIITVIEYVTSWLMEALFHARWWDYSNIPLNLNGRVALPISAFWGVGMLVIIKVIHPLVAQVVTHIDARYGVFAAFALIALFAFDFGFTLANLLAFGAATKRIGDTIAATKQELQQKAAATGARLEAEYPWLEQYRQDAESRAKLPRLSHVQRRLLKSFPHLKLHDTHTSATDISALAELVNKLKKS
ncbi:putative ABC transporter permease [Lacticaseibacillus daqingensis]|uniref:putative ABC transporter permease n=1 Tax=Lacticaseibacillus daqingensis TaxID=2486014 RepID=UPI000F7A9A4E|nr:putative ABC transporter permease [Lacticaseibacillus daqingensis]